MRLLYVTDLHGSTWKYGRLLATAQRFQAQLLVNGGDMLPKSGDMHGDQRRFITGFLDDHFAQFDAAGIPYLCYLGNDDLRVHDTLFEETCQRYPHVTNLAQRQVHLGDYDFIGMNWVTDYPFRLKDRCRLDSAEYQFQEQYGRALLSIPGGYQELDDWFSYARSLLTIEDEMNRLVRPQNMTHAIYVLHMPPSGLGLDKTGLGLEVGSQAIYNFLRQHQPKLSLHGHIHESPEMSGRWYGHIGRTIAIQPGQLHPFTYAVIDLPTLHLERHTEPA